jgi:hypothetical protein
MCLYMCLIYVYMPVTHIYMCEYIAYANLFLIVYRSVLLGNKAKLKSSIFLVFLFVFRQPSCLTSVVSH